MYMYVYNVAGTVSTVSVRLPILLLSMVVDMLLASVDNHCMTGLSLSINTNCQLRMHYAYMYVL